MLIPVVDVNTNVRGSTRSCFLQILPLSTSFSSCRTNFSQRGIELANFWFEHRLFVLVDSQVKNIGDAKLYIREKRARSSLILLLPLVTLVSLHPRFARCGRVSLTIRMAHEAGRIIHRSDVDSYVYNA